MYISFLYVDIIYAKTVFNFKQFFKPDIQLFGQPDIRPDIRHMKPNIKPDTGYQKRAGYPVQLYFKQVLNKKKTAML